MFCGSSSVVESGFTLLSAIARSHLQREAPGHGWHFFANMSSLLSLEDSAVGSSISAPSRRNDSHGSILPAPPSHTRKGTSSLLRESETRNKHSLRWLRKPRLCRSTQQMFEVRFLNRCLSKKAVFLVCDDSPRTNFLRLDWNGLDYLHDGL